MPTNPSRKINVRRQRGSAASSSWPNIVWSAKPIGQHNKLAKNPQEPQLLSSKLTVSYSSALRLLRPLYLETSQMESMLAAMPSVGDMVAVEEEEAGEVGPTWLPRKCRRSLLGDADASQCTPNFTCTKLNNHRGLCITHRCDSECSFVFINSHHYDSERSFVYWVHQFVVKLKLKP